MSVSDTLSDAVAEIDEYLKEPWPAGWTSRIIRLRDEMDAVRRELDRAKLPQDGWFNLKG